MNIINKKNIKLIYVSLNKKTIKEFNNQLQYFNNLFYQQNNIDEIYYKLRFIDELKFHFTNIC